MLGHTALGQVALGESQGTSDQTISCAGIASTLAFGSATITIVPVAVYPYGIASTAGFGVPYVSRIKFIAATDGSLSLSAASTGSLSLTASASNTLTLDPVYG